MIKEFAQFLREYKIISLAIAFVMGAAATTLVTSFVNDIVMPLLAPIFGSESWKEATLSMGSVHLAYGSFLAAFLNFLILAIIVFVIARKLFKLEAK